MSNDASPLFIIEPTFLWAEGERLIGKIYIFKHYLEYVPDHFQNSHLTCTIYFSDIIRIQEFLLFDIARNGLSIHSKDDRIDQFILDEPAEVKAIINGLRSKH